MGLRFKVNLTISIVSVILAVMTVYILVDDRRKSIRQEIEAGNKVTVQLMESVVLSRLPFLSGTNPAQTLSEFLKEVGRVRANEIRFFDLDGNLIYESPPSVYKQGRWAPDWFSELMSPGLREFNLKLPFGNIVITADASRSILDAWDELQRIGLLLLVFFIALNGLTFGLLGRGMRPLGGILSAMSQLEKGNLSTRLPTYRTPEFEAISQTFNRMAVSLHDAQAESARLALVAQQSSDAIIITDTKGIISFWNPAAETMFGYTVTDMLGNTMNKMIPEVLLGEQDSIQRRVVEMRSVEQYESQRVKRYGDVVDVSVACAPLVDPDDESLMGQIHILRDMSDQKSRVAAEMELEQNKKLTQLIQEKLEEERKHIARELHDEMGQYLTAIKTIGTAISNRHASDATTDTHENAATIVEVTSHIYDMVHSIIRDLRPSALDHLGLADAITDLCNRHKASNGALSLDLNIEGHLDQFDEHANITVYRVIQECLTNSAKHSGATQVSVSVTVTELEDSLFDVVLTVEDNGAGIEEGTADTSRFGLMGMRERVQAFDGDVKINSTKGSGAKIVADLKIKRSATQLSS